MLDKIRNWFGFGGFDQHPRGGGHDHDHGDSGGHGHTHGVIDPSIASTERGVWAIKWSFIILAITAAIQFAVVLVSGVLSRNRRKFRQPINVACPAPGRWGRPNSRVTSRHFDHGNASRTSRPDCSGLDEAD